MRSSPILVGFMLLSGAAHAQSGAASVETCPNDYDFANAMDFLDPKYQPQIRGIERNHLNSDVENLVRGQSTASPGGDLRFILSSIPNHPRALAALMRLATVERTETPTESGPYTVRCWLHRATIFSPLDGTAFLMYGVYLARNAQPRDALGQLEQAATLLPNNAEVEYNLGLIHLNLKNYDAARLHGQRAYDLGYPLPGLRRRLAAAGFPLN